MPRTSAKKKPAASRVPAAPSKARAFYSVAEPFNAAGGRKRRVPVVERVGEEQNPQLGPRARLLGIDATRDLLRNSPQMRGLARTIRTNTIGNAGQLVFSEEGEWYRAAADYFNHKWGKHADFIDGTTWRETLQLVVYALAFEGDAVALWDGGELSPRHPSRRGTGRLAFFEADQIANLVPADWTEYCKRAGHEGWHQVSGVILDDLSRKCGVIVSRHRGLSEVVWRDALVLLCDPDDPDAAHWRHVTRKFRLRQLRGSADALPSATTVQDALEMTDYELQSAKRGAANYAAILAKDAPVSPVDMAALPDPATLAPEGSAAAAAPAAAGAAGDADDEPGDDLGATNLARISGGQADYWQGVEKIEWNPATRPSDRVVEFLEHAIRMAGRAHGLNASYALGRAEGSYTAFRGDLTMSWCTFSDNQQFLEDIFSDWAAVHVLRRAIDLREIPGTPPDGWEGRIRWTYPRMPAVDEEKEQRAILAKLRNGTTTLRDELGPAWRDILRQRNTEREFCATLGLTLAQDETTPGSQPTPTTENNATANE
jgi:capsid protein